MKNVLFATLCTLLSIGFVAGTVFVCFYYEKGCAYVVGSILTIFILYIVIYILTGIWATFYKIFEG